MPQYAASTSIGCGNGALTMALPDRRCAVPSCGKVRTLHVAGPAALVLMVWAVACGGRGGAIHAVSSPTGNIEPTPLCASARTLLAAEPPFRTTRFTVAVKQQWTVSPVSFVMTYLDGERSDPDEEKEDAVGETRTAGGRRDVNAALAAFVAKAAANPAGVPLWEDLNRQAVASVLRAAPQLRAVASFVEVGGSAYIPTYRASAVYWQTRLERGRERPETGEEGASETERVLAQGQHCEAFFFRATRLQFPGGGGRVFDVPISYAFRPGARRYPDYLSVFDFAVNFLLEAVGPSGPRSALANELALGIAQHPVFAKEMAQVNAVLLLHDESDRARYAQEQPYASGVPAPFVQLAGARLPKGTPSEAALNLP